MWGPAKWNLVAAMRQQTYRSGSIISMLLIARTTSLTKKREIRKKKGFLSLLFTSFILSFDPNILMSKFSKTP